MELYKRGISPIIASILMIVITVSLGAVAYLWMQGSIRGFMSQTDKQTEIIKSAIQNLKISDCFYKKIIKKWEYPNFKDWKCNPSCKTYICGSIGGMLGGYNNFGKNSYAYVTVNLENLLIPPGNYKICFDWIKGDSWDNEEARLYINKKLIWSKKYGNVGSNICGGKWNELVDKICKTFYYNGKSFTIKFDSTLDQPAYDEWWGINNIMILADPGLVYLVSYNPSNIPIELNGTEVSIKDAETGNTVCTFPMIYNKTFITSLGTSKILPNQQVTIVIKLQDTCKLSLGKNYQICLMFKGKKVCGNFDVHT